MVRAWFGKYGAALLIISPWIPFAGDVVPIVAGIEEFNPTTFLIIMFVAKAIKGTAVVYLPLLLRSAGWRALVTRQPLRA